MSELSVDKKGKNKAAQKNTPSTPTPITPISLQEPAGGGLTQVPSSSKDSGKIGILSSSASLAKKGLVGHSVEYDLPETLKRKVIDEDNDGIPTLDKKLKILDSIKVMIGKPYSIESKHGREYSLRLSAIGDSLACYKGLESFEPKQ